MAGGNARVMRCTPEDVFATLADGWLYPVWVVGAARMRAVSPEWPERGSTLHHSVGLWPVLIDDSTEIVSWSPPRRIRLRAKAGPFGRAVVVIDVREHGDGCVVRMGEEPVAGAGRLLPRLIWAPLLRARNRETLRRLGFLAEGRRRERDAGEQTAREEVPETAPSPAGSQASADVAAATDAAADAGAPPAREAASAAADAAGSADSADAAGAAGSADSADTAEAADRSA